MLNFTRRAASAAVVAALTFVSALSPAHAQRTATPTPRLVQSAPEGFASRSPGALDAAAAWADLINRAVRTLDIATPVATDAPGSPAAAVFAAIRDAAQLRGVRVRLLLDAKATKARGAIVPEARLRYDASDLDGAQGIEVRRIAFAGGIDGAYIVADGEYAFAGSHRLDWRSMSENHEAGALFSGRAAERVVRLFEHDWRAAAEQAVGRKFEADPARETGAVEVESLLDREPVLAVTPPMGGQIAAIDVLSAVLAGARKTLDIEITAFSTAHVRAWNELKDRLTAAARRGVAVRFSVSDRQLLTKGRLADVQSLSRLPGVEVRLSMMTARTAGCVAHTRFDNARLVIADGETVVIGGAAWSHEGFYATRSVLLAARGGELAENARSIFEAAWTSKSMRVVRTNMPAPITPDAECRRTK